MFIYRNRLTQSTRSASNGWRDTRVPTFSTLSGARPAEQSKAILVVGVLQIEEKTFFNLAFQLECSFAGDVTTSSIKHRVVAHFNVSSLLRRPIPN